MSHRKHKSKSHLYAPHIEIYINIQGVLFKFSPQVLKRTFMENPVQIQIILKWNPVLYL